MSLAIATATLCSCGAPVLLIALPPGSRQPSGHKWQAHCERCVVPNEATGPSYVAGLGDSPHGALWAWQDAHDQAYAASLKLTKLGREVTTAVVDVWRQASAEAKRQEGWFRRVDEGPDGPTVLWAPNRFDSVQQTAQQTETGAGS